jgi:hypothetical protein
MLKTPGRIGCAFVLLAGCASEPESSGFRALPADPLAAAITDICVPALKDMSKLPRLAAEAGFDWIDLQDKDMRPMAVAKAVSVSEDAQGVCKVTFSVTGTPGLESFEAIWAKANHHAFGDGPPLRQTKAPDANAAFSCRDTPQRSLLVTMAEGSASPERLDVAGQSFVRLGRGEPSASIRIFLIDADCAAMDERLGDERS